MWKKGIDTTCIGFKSVSIESFEMKMYTAECVLKAIKLFQFEWPCFLECIHNIPSVSSPVLSCSCKMINGSRSYFPSTAQKSPNIKQATQFSGISHLGGLFVQSLPRHVLQEK